MDIKEIKQVIDLMKRSDLLEFEIEEESLKLRIKRAPKNAEIAQQPVISLPAATHPPFLVEQPRQPVPTSPAQQSFSGPEKPQEDVNIDYIKAPMVGTFYRAPSPDSPSFVEVGTKIQSDTVLCIIEAMKVMNEIHAEVTGTIVEVLVESGESVEYGQALFKVKKH